MLENSEVITGPVDVDMTCKALCHLNLDKFCVGASVKAQVIHAIPNGEVPDLYLQRVSCTDTGNSINGAQELQCQCAG